MAAARKLFQAQSNDLNESVILISLIELQSVESDSLEKTGFRNNILPVEALVPAA